MVKVCKQIGESLKHIKRLYRSEIRSGVCCFVSRVTNAMNQIVKKKIFDIMEEKI